MAHHNVLFVLIFLMVSVIPVSGFIPTLSQRYGMMERGMMERGMPHYANNGPNDKSSTKQSKGFLDDLKGMLANFDDIVDDFVMKRMGAGEQWYGKRKYNPSGRVDGDYNGMGRSSHYAIEIARVQKEVLEERRQRRLEEEAARKNN